nr:MAG TPA: hypothetical protein [Caudoviricetes sp.]
MRRPKATSETVVHFTMMRRPGCAKHGDQRGRVWRHKYQFLDSAFCRAASQISPRSFTFNQ